MGEYQRAVDDFNRALELDPGWPWALRVRGLAYAALGQGEKANVDMTEAIKNAPDDPTSYLYRGLLYSELGYDKWANDDLKRVLELTDDPELRKPAEEALGEQGGGLSGFFKKFLG
jgi:tetratricopeptide (TPR) repeat protein